MSSLKIQATNVFCIPVLSYGFGVIEWIASEISHFDVQIHRALFNLIHITLTFLLHVCLPQSVG